MKGRKWAGRRAAVAIFVAVVIAAVPVYAESEPEIFADNSYSPRDYDGIVTDEMIEEWEQKNGTDSATDSYGNDIEWDIHGNGDEDGAGYESSADMMEAPTYGSEEQREILENIKETDEISEKGWLYIKGELEDDWPGYNVTVALYDKNHKRVEITVYSQNNFQVREEMREGVYKVYRAYVPGDENGRQYPLVVSDSKIEVAKDETAELTVWRATVIKGEKEIEEQISLEKEELQHAPFLADMIAAAGIGIGMLLIFILGTVVYKRILNHDRYQ